MRTSLGAKLVFFARSRRANFATMGALAAPVVMALGAVAVDQGALYVERRALQSAADIAAIAAAAEPNRAKEAALQAFTDNGFLSVSVTVANEPAPPSFDGSRVKVLLAKGSYTPDPSLPVSTRYAQGNGHAVRVTAHMPGTLHFAASLRSPPTIGVSAIASADPRAAFSVGSRLLRLNGGVLNQLLGSLLGTNVQLDLMDYNALVDARISLFDFLDGLATRLNLTAATYDTLLDSDISLGDIHAELLRVGGLSARAQAAVPRLGMMGQNARTLKLRKLIDLGTAGLQPVGNRPAGFTPKLSAMDLVSAAAQLNAATDGRQIGLDLTAFLPGLAKVELALAIGEPPQHSGWLRAGTSGEIIRTAQTRLLLNVQVGINLPWPANILGRIVHVPLYLEIAYGEGRLAGISCTTNGSVSRVAVAAQPGIAELRLADVSPERMRDFVRPVPIRPATLIDLAAVTASASAHAKIENQRTTTLQFTKSDIDNGTIRRVQTTQALQSLTTTLFENLKVNVRLLGADLLGVGTILEGTLGGVLKAASPALDGVLNSVLAALGISLGELDVQVHGATCGRSVLVQ